MSSLGFRVRPGAPHSFLSARGRLRHEIGAGASSPSSVACLRVVAESGRKGFGGGEEGNKKKATKKHGGGGSGKQLQGGAGIRREESSSSSSNKRAVAVKEGSRQLQNVLRSVDKVTFIFFFSKDVERRIFHL